MGSTAQKIGKTGGEKWGNLGGGGEISNFPISLLRCNSRVARITRFAQKIGSCERGKVEFPRISPDFPGKKRGGENGENAYKSISLSPLLFPATYGWRS